MLLYTLFFILSVILDKSCETIIFRLDNSSYKLMWIGDYLDALKTRYIWCNYRILRIYCSYSYYSNRTSVIEAVESGRPLSWKSEKKSRESYFEHLEIIKSSRITANSIKLYEIINRKDANNKYDLKMILRVTIKVKSEVINK